MTVRDWRGVPPARMASLYRRETARWKSTLAWDMTDSWSTVETARTTWGLPGLVCSSAGDEIQGWTFYMCGDRGLDIGGVTADSDEATAALVAALMTRAGSPDKIHGLLYAAAPALLETLAGHGIPFVRYSYNERLLSSPPAACAPSDMHARRAGLRPWSEADFQETVTLLRRAYEKKTSPLGHDATADQWSAYLRNITRHDGCGRFSTSLSQTLRIDGVLAAASLVSTIGPRSAHVVQFVVDPTQQRKGLGRALLEMTAERAAAAGYTSVSLLVAEDNEPARELYAKGGFLRRGVFVQLGSALAIDQRSRRN